MQERIYLNIKGKLPFLYVERGVLSQHNYTLYFYYEEKSIEIPIGSILVIFLGPGIRITHNAFKIISRNKCLTMLVGENITRSYAMCIREDRTSHNIDKQIRIHTKYPDKLIKRYLSKRFNNNYKISKRDSIEKIRGIEGNYMKKAYREYALKYGIPWVGRKISGEWSDQTDYNKAISMSNSYLYGIICACLNSLGYLSALGIIHKGNMSSLIYDIADIYKIDISIKIGFKTASIVRSTNENIEKVTRKELLEYLVKSKFINQVVEDIEYLYDPSYYNI